MMSIRVSCPYCNSSVLLPENPASGRAACPRCGETFPVVAAEQADDPAGGRADSPGTGEATAPTLVAARSSLPSGRAILVSLALAAAVLGGGLYYLRPAPPPPAAPAESRPAGTVPPPAVTGLRYLPAGANVVFAVQPAPLVAYAGRMNTDPKSLFAAAGVPADVIATLDRLGVPLTEIDHVAGGVTLGDAGLPGVAVVLRLRQPVADEERFLRTLRAEKKAKAGRPVYSLAGFPLPEMTKLDDRTYLFGLSDKDLSGADGPPAPLPKELQLVLTSKLSPASFAWVATDAEKWGEKPLIKLFADGSKDPKVRTRLALLGKGRQAVVGLSLEPAPRLRLAVRAADAELGQQLRDYFGEKLAGDGAELGGSDDWAEASVPFDPKAGASVWKKLLPEGK